MPRQPTLSPENMRALFIQCAEDAIRQEGLKNATARNIAARAHYTAGTLYTCFRNLDDLLLNVQIRVLDRLRTSLTDACAEAEPADAVASVTSAYLHFARENLHLWTLILKEDETQLPELQARFVAAMNDIRAVYVDAVAKRARANGRGTTNGNGHGNGACDDPAVANLLWMSAHGLTTIATSRKMPIFTRQEIDALVSTITECINH